MQIKTALLAAALVGARALSPVTRVVELLKALQEKTEDEGKQEEKLYNGFVCWGKGNIADKKESNAASEARIEELNQYIADLDAGRIELTSERVDLEKELEAIHGDMEVATDMRNKEKADFEEAQKEMNQAIDALTDAIEVLKTATAGHEKGVLLSVHGQERAGIRSAQSASLSRAVEMGKKFLTKGDALFLQRLLTGEVPTWDWKKLNRKATFKMSYKARSYKIQDVLAQLLETFASNLKEAEAKEADAQATYDKLMDSKGKQKKAAQDALDKMEKESGAKGMSRSDASAEVDMLTKQVADDKKYIGQLQDALDKKKTEWKARQSLRAEEQEAISKAIAILHGDDARDLFKRSFTSQGYLFLQEGTSAQARQSSAASETLRVAGQASKDGRLLALAARIGAAAGRFDAVIDAIDKMLVRLKAEEADDLEKKETCEKERMENTRDAILKSRAIDEQTELMNRLAAEIEVLKQEIAQNEEKIKKIEATIEELIKIRLEETAAYQIAKKDDQDAAKLVQEATDVLQTFYTSNNLMFAQKQPGQAPPPPPKTWDAPYGGKTEEATGIIAILGMVKEDIEKDIRKGDADEAEAEKIFNDTVAKLDKEKGNLRALNIKLTKSKGVKETDKADAKAERQKLGGALEIVMKTIADAEPGCDYFTIKYPLRLKDRQIEMDGLLKAKAILQGATFTKNTDATREIKPGDAFLQKAQRHIQ